MSHTHQNKRQKTYSGVSSKFHDSYVAEEDPLPVTANSFCYCASTARRNRQRHASCSEFDDCYDYGVPHDRQQNRGCDHFRLEGSPTFPQICSCQRRLQFDQRCRPRNGSQTSLLRGHFQTDCKRELPQLPNDAFNAEQGNVRLPGTVVKYDIEGPVTRLVRRTGTCAIGINNMAYRKRFYLVCVLNIIFLTFNAIIFPQFFLKTRDYPENCVNCTLLKGYYFDVEERRDGLCCFSTTRNNINGASPRMARWTIQTDPVNSFIQLQPPRAGSFIYHERIKWEPETDIRSNMELNSKDHSLVVVKQSGVYLAYSRIQYKKDFLATSPSNEFLFGHGIYKIAGNAADEELDKVTQKCSVFKSNIAHTSVLQSIIELRKGDEIYVGVNHTEFIDANDRSGHKFGLFYFAHSNDDKDGSSYFPENKDDSVFK